MDIKAILNEINDMTYLFSSSNQDLLREVIVYLSRGRLFDAVNVLSNIKIFLSKEEVYLDDFLNKWIEDLNLLIVNGFLFFPDSFEFVLFETLIKDINVKLKLVSNYPKKYYLVDINTSFSGVLYLPESIDFIFNKAFSRTLYDEIYIGKNTLNFDFDAFAGCRNLSKVYLNDKITEISSCMFKMCRNLENVYFGKNVEIIRDCAFWGDKNLEEFTFYDDLKKIEYGAFGNCKSLKTINQTSNNSFIIHSNVFENCANLEEFNVYEDMIIMEDAFKGCKNLKVKIHLLKKDNKFDLSLFKDCKEILFLEDF